MNQHSDMPIPEHQSIFTDTYHGVPSPTIPHDHPYPTRYHGPVFTTPRFMLPYRQQTMVAPQGILPWAGGAFSGFRGFGCGGGRVHPDGSVEKGLAGDELLMGRVTDSGPLDGAIGAAAGYLASPNKEDRMMWTAGAGLATYLLGKVGLVAVVGAALYVRVKRR